MKTFINQFAIIALVISLFLTFSQISAAQTNAPQALRGAEAVNQLKQTGRYDSLVSAVKAARQADGQSDETPDAPDAVGQTAQLTASFGGLRDQFGSSVALSGNTAIVGAPYNDPNGVADQGAAYIFVNNGTTWTQQAKLNLNTNAGSNIYFGTSVGISGDTVIVGARGENVGSNPQQGAAYIYIRTGTTWTQQARLTTSDGSSYGGFGSSVGISGEAVVVGAPGYTVGANAYQGAAYVFARSGTAWSQTQLVAADGAAFDAFGTSVAISGETVVVGAYLDSTGTGNYHGSAYIYTRGGVSWSQQAKLLAGDFAAGDRFGYSVGISGNTAIVGAIESKIGANNAQGSAYIFVSNGGIWVQQAKLIASDGAAGDSFGFSVAVEGNTAVVGSLDDQVGANYNQGSAYIYTRDVLNTWTQQAKLTASDGAANDDFGSSVAINGGNIIVGAYNDTVSGSYARGSAEVFRTLSSNWTQDAKSVDPLGMANDQFGGSVAVSGSTAIVGAPQTAIGSNAAQGAAWIFVRNGASWTLQTSFYDADGAANEQFGTSVAISGDTIIVGASGYTAGANSNQGTAYIFVRNNGVWSRQAQLNGASGAANDAFGYSVGISGDTAIVGAYAVDVGANVNQGAAYIFTRSGTSWSQQQQLNGTGGAANDRFGASVGISGDTAVVGAPRNTVGANGNQGSAYIFVRNGATWTQQQQLNGAGGAANDSFGASVAVSGDTIIVGAPQNDVGANADQGSAYIFVRNGAAWTQQAQLNGTGGAAGDNFGGSVGIDGDTAIVGAYLDDVGMNADQGSAYIFDRSGTTWAQRQQLTDTSGAAGDNFGGSVAVSGDKVVGGAPGSDASALTRFSDAGKPSSPTAADQGAAIFFVNAPLAPTAADVSISGRIITPETFGLTNALVTLTDSRGISRTVVSGKFGSFIFREVKAGETYIISVQSKRYTYAPQIVTVNEDLTNLTFTPQ